jgi:serine/threonine protein kinase
MCLITACIHQNYVCAGNDLKITDINTQNQIDFLAYETIQKHFPGATIKRIEKTDECNCEHMFQVCNPDGTVKFAKVTNKEETADINEALEHICHHKLPSNEIGLVLPDKIINLNDEMDMHVSTFMNFLNTDTLIQFFLKGKIEKEELSKAFQLAAQAIGALHSHGFVHGDLNGCNIFYANQSGYRKQKIWIIDNGSVRYSSNHDRMMHEFRCMRLIDDLLRFYIYNIEDAEMYRRNLDDLLDVIKVFINNYSFGSDSRFIASIKERIVKMTERKLPKEQAEKLAQTILHKLHIL